MSLIRRAAFAGRFYPADPIQCARVLEEFRASNDARPPAADQTIGAAPHSAISSIKAEAIGSIEPEAIGAIAPHAGWIFSGEAAALSVAALAAARPETVVIFGAVHVRDRNAASIFPSGKWETPLGDLVVDSELAGRIARCRHVTIDPVVHAAEHSIEVELPLIRHILGDVKIVPLIISAGEKAAEIGQFCGKVAAESGRRVTFLASSDFTHYGPMFHFEPHGRGIPGFRWAKGVNDRQIIRRIADFDENGIVPEAAFYRNACGAGAIAATIAAARELGAARYLELQHTTSAESGSKIHAKLAAEVGAGSAAENDPADFNSVGYEAGIFVR